MTADNVGAPGRSGPPIVLVTGASTGIGRATAQSFVRRGYQVLGTCRNPSALRDDDRIAGVEYLPLSLEDPDSVAACAKAAGAVEVLVNNAGVSQMGPFEFTDVSAMEDLFAVNVFGTVRLTQALLPGMRERRSGAIVMVGSLLAEFPLAFRSTYVASKAALKGYTLAARKELEPFGIRMSIVEPNYYKSAIASSRQMDAVGTTPYEREYAAVREETARGDAGGGDPSEVGEKIAAIVASARPAPLYALGGTGPMLLQARRMVSNRFAESILARRYGLGSDRP